MSSLPDNGKRPASCCRMTNFGRNDPLAVIQLGCSVLNRELSKHLLELTAADLDGTSIELRLYRHETMDTYGKPDIR